MKIGVLDIGSTTAQLQVTEAVPGAPPLPTHAFKQRILLGEALQPDGAIADDGIDRVIDGVRMAATVARDLQVDRLYAFATSAIRDATNAGDIAARLSSETGVQPRFLSGEDEARLTYLAVRRWYGWSAGRLLVLDIGGGSMEIALGRDAQPDVAVSLPLGAGRLTRTFLPDDPPSLAQLHELRHYVRTTLRQVSDRLLWEGDPKQVIGSSKTFKQLARLAGAPPQRRGPFVRRSLTRKEVRRWLPRLAAMSSADRARLRGISQYRARQSLAGAVIANAAMTTLDIKNLVVSPWALREGILLHHLETITDQEHPLAVESLQPVTALAPAPAVVAAIKR